jgi:hypothetical protein
LVSKKVEFTEVEAAVEVKVEALFSPKDVELISLVSLKNSELSLVYFDEIGDKLWVKLVV